MEEKRFAQVHLIPFDIGYAFYDPLLIDNKNNLENASKFIDRLQRYYSKKGIEVIPNYELQIQNDKVTKFYCKRNQGADNAIGIVKFTKNLFCYILTNGIGIFVLYDSNNEALKNSTGIEKHNIVLKAACEKKIAQASILNQYEGEHVFKQYEEIMLEFREICWKIIREIATVHKSLIRKFSSNKLYKSNGLSYVLTIHIFREGTITPKEVNSLMYSYLLSGIIKKENWQSIEEELKEEKQYEEKKIEITNEKIYFAWSGIAVITDKFTEIYEELIKNPIISALIRAEVYIQSRWFIADNSIDNINKSSNYNLESLQKIASMIEFSQAEIENETSANMDRLYKSILEGVVQSSNVKNIYQSVSSQLNIQKKIKEAYYADKRSRNRFLGNCFLAIFTACSLYQAVYDLITVKFNLWKGILFATILLISIIAVWIEYKNE